MIETIPPEYGDLDTTEIWINMGPHHPSTHGVFSVILKLDGETVTDSRLGLGYLHRGLEKLAEQYTYGQYIPIVDRMDYINGPSNELAYVMAVEKLAGITPPERAEYIRVILAELARYQNHLMAIGFLLNDLGAYFTPVMYGFRERERILDLWEMAAGSRMMPNYLRFGGVLRDLPEGWVPALNQTLDVLDPFVDEYERLLSDNEILKARTIGVGVLPADLAVNYSCSGPMLRASGVAYDIRRAEPYSIYDRFEFGVITRPGGDAYDRYMVRLLEMRESLKIIRQAVKQMPEGETYNKPRGIFRPAAGEAYARVESPKGELGFYVVSDGTPKPYRVKVRAPSYINLNPFQALIKGAKVADVVVVLGSIDIILGEVDR